MNCSTVSSSHLRKIPTWPSSSAHGYPLFSGTGVASYGRNTDLVCLGDLSYVEWMWSQGLLENGSSSHRVARSEQLIRGGGGGGG